MAFAAEDTMHLQVDGAPISVVTIPPDDWHGVGIGSPVELTAGSHRVEIRLDITHGARELARGTGSYPALTAASTRRARGAWCRRGCYAPTRRCALLTSGWGERASRARPCLDDGLGRVVRFEQIQSARGARGAQLDEHGLEQQIWRHGVAEGGAEHQRERHDPCETVSRNLVEEELEQPGYAPL